MAVQGVNFAAQVSEWVRETKERTEAVFKESAQRVISEMQAPVAAGGNMPVDTGFLRASMQVSLGSSQPMTRSKPAEAGSYSYSPTAAALVIAGAEIGATIYASYTANYAGFVHYGRAGKTGRQWVTMAAQRWPAIVAQVSGELQGRVAARSGSGA